MKLQRECHCLAESDIDFSFEGLEEGILVQVGHALDGLEDVGAVEVFADVIEFLGDLGQALFEVFEVQELGIKLWRLNGQGRRMIPLH